MSRDSLFIQLHELKAQRAGISPKLGLHQALTKQIEEIRAQIGGLDHDIPHKIPVKHLPPVPKVCEHKRARKCLVPACKNRSKNIGRRSCGHVRYDNYCHKHTAKDL